MVKNYEESVARYWFTALAGTKYQPKTITYGSEYSIFEMITSVNMFPCMFFNRTPTDWDVIKPVRIYDRDNSGNIIAPMIVGFKQSYVAVFCVEKEVEALELAALLRGKMFRNTHVKVAMDSNYPDIKEEVLMQLVSVKNNTERNNSGAANKDLGSLRTVTLTWWSNLFLKYLPEEAPVIYDEVRVWVAVSNSELLEAGSEPERSNDPEISVTEKFSFRR